MIKTKEQIKLKGLELFNAEGISNITLRNIAKDLGKSYGNITYHYKTKEQLIQVLYIDMLEELKLIGAQLHKSSNLFVSIINAPKLTFDLSLKYLFLFKDYIEIKRNYSAIAQAIDFSNSERKKGYKQLLSALQQQGLFRKDLDGEDLDYLMELSGAMRTFFFLNLAKSEYNAPDLRDRYVEYINRLIIPYLSRKGKEEYLAIQNAFE